VTEQVDGIGNGKKGQPLPCTQLEMTVEETKSGLERHMWITKRNYFKS